MSELRCPDCGYSQEDADIHGDHHLCIGKIPVCKPTKSAERIGYDELLQRRAEQLRLIDDRLERIEAGEVEGPSWVAIRNLRNELLTMIREAEAEHTAF